MTRSIGVCWIPVAFTVTLACNGGEHPWKDDTVGDTDTDTDVDTDTDADTK